MSNGKNPNVRLRTNVICVASHDGFGQAASHREEAKFKSRLTYWELIEYSHANPLEFHFDKNKLTPEQLKQKDAFIKEGGASLWGQAQGLMPMPPRWVANPFVATEAIVIQDVKPPTSTPSDSPPLNHAGPNTPPDAPSAPMEQASGDDGGPIGQEGIIEAPAGRNYLVVAPPGTGKTHAVIGRICHLITHRMVESPAREILVLSFTRSAVTEIARRVARTVGDGGQDDLRYVTARTFDSFATSMLLRDLAPEALAGKSYEERIALFTTRLSSDRLPEAKEILSEVRYLIIDEVQDLNGARAEMVLRVMRFVSDHGGNVLLLGDPAQAIYEFDLGPNDLPSAKFLERARTMLDPVVVEFNDYHRFSGAMQDFVLRAREAVGPMGTEPDGAAFDQLLRETGAPMDLQQLGSALAGSDSIAILTRTNVEAYQISDWLDDRGVENHLHRGAQGDAWPGWVARLVLGFRGDHMGLPLAQTRWDALVGDRTVGFGGAWRYLETQGAVVDDVLDVEALARRVRQRAPSPVTSAGPRVVISTIHRSKGLEFDRVYVLMPRSDSAGDPEEVRLLYVAATRARGSLSLLQRDAKVLPRFRRHWKTAEFVHFVRRKDDDVTIFLDGTSSLDMSAFLDPADNRDPAEVRQRQDLLWEMAQHGTPVSISPAGTRHVLQADGMPEGAILARMARSVSDDLHSICRVARRRIDMVGDLQVSALVTESFASSPGAEDLLGTARLAVVPLVRGMAFTHMREVDSVVGS